MPIWNPGKTGKYPEKFSSAVRCIKMHRFFIFMQEFALKFRFFLTIRGLTIILCVRYNYRNFIKG